MIPADRWSDNGDGTAWLITELSGKTWQRLDRPCDACDGCGAVGPHGYEDECSACSGSGRHTFEVEVLRQDCPPDCIAKHPGATRRVSVVSVLRTFGWSHPLDPQMTFPCLIRMARGYWLTAQTEFFSDGFHVPLPPAAAPGMRAVLVRLAGVSLDLDFVANSTTARFEATHPVECGHSSGELFANQECEIDRSTHE